MKASYINPFISSSVNIIETFVQAKPTVGDLKLINVELLDNHIWLEIGIMGEFKGNVLFGIPEEVALKIVSAMMGGYAVTQLDEMCQSAISELGNMISGNATTLLYNDGIQVDITPPSILKDYASSEQLKAVTVPLHIPDIGEFRINMILPG
ncbi:chemotaxis protein CheX [Paenibacillus arenilitoris]|uniref:Chemotaxis protein CheX n=1 Tax=Paenibacillus arenilitoris TaxID=2772299 RepID=A0A927CN48_9BACL|nr:chemotaxis protein CheX [Paenibacillus arenilitoris]MBD2868886.1 chemotaxis protein CheX [Paenibacillus arenilitoris]